MATDDVTSMPLSVVAPVVPTGPSRPRGRPPKSKDPLAPAKGREIPDRNAQPCCSRGRPLKPKPALPEDYVPGPSRPRGRPPKSKDSLAPMKKKEILDRNAPPRPDRGRPPKPKPALPEDYVPGPSRPRGRPPKSKDQLAPEKIREIPDPNAPPRRCRGRPPKPKPALPEDNIPSPSRPRGRPPKSKDLLVPTKRKDVPAGTGRKRERPTKLSRTTDFTEAPPPLAVAISGGAPRDRGSQPKVKPALPAAATWSFQYAFKKLYMQYYP